MEELVNALKRLLDDASTYLAILAVPVGAIAMMFLGFQLVNTDEGYEAAAIKRKAWKLIGGIGLIGFGPKLVSWIWSYFSAG